MKGSFALYFECADTFPEIVCERLLSEDRGYFAFGRDVLCFGCSRGLTSSSPRSVAYDARSDVVVDASRLRLPFDLDEVVSNFRLETYANSSVPAARRVIQKTTRRAYYTVRAVIPDGLRRKFQRLYLNDWQDLSFPHWPVDTTVDDLMWEILKLPLASGVSTEVPFIWFWPRGATGCVIVTHDVETQTGVASVPNIMDTDDSFGIPASFQIVPEERYSVTPEFLSQIQSRGFEVNVQDLNHDGKLFEDERTFRSRARRINVHRQAFGARGFRSAILYRNQKWLELLDFDYDMSVPNVAHLDPQRGGCCSVMPYFVADMVELPVTMTQDYSLFYFLGRCDMGLWQQQWNLVLRRNGLISFIIHPDYLQEDKQWRLYKDLLQMIIELKKERNLWMAYPHEVSTWWRQRSQMKLSKEGGKWRVCGEGSDRAAVAIARLEGNEVSVTVAAA